MNARNTDMFFNENNGETTFITLTDENGNEFDTEMIAAIKIEELQKEYIAVLPTEPNADFDEGEAIILIYSEDEDGDPVFESIEDEEEFQLAGEAFQQFFEDNSDDDEDEDDEDNQDNYLDDIGELFPGISIQKENE